MVQESTNTFSDGLIKDLNPLTTPTTVLTDAKNATLLTFNGNELVLQNDFGNSKIKGVNLKEGYNPIGVKEYGGILYIVSIDKENNVEIGSFPSPGFKEEISNENELKTLVISNTGEYLNTNLILSNIKINPGDKFLIALNTENLDLLTEPFGDKTRNYYKIKLLSINEGVEVDLTDYLTEQEKYDSDLETWNTTNHWFVPLLGTETINLQDYIDNNKLQIYKYKKRGRLAIRIELETIDEFKIYNNETEYPQIQQSDEGKNLIFNLYSKFESKIKPNKIIFNSILYNKNNISQIPELYNESVGFNPNTTIENNSQIIVPLGDESLNKILDYTIEIESNELVTINELEVVEGYDIIFDKFTLKNRIDLSKDPLSWNNYNFWKYDTIYIEDNGDYYWYLIIARYGYIKGVLTPLKSDDTPIQSQTLEHAAYIYSGINPLDYVNYQDYKIIGTFDIDLNDENETYNKAINFKDLDENPTLDSCTNIIRYENELISGYIYKGSVLDAYSLQLLTSSKWRVPTASEVLEIVNTGNASLFKSVREWGDDIKTNESKFTALQNLTIISTGQFYENNVRYWTSSTNDLNRTFFGFTLGSNSIDNQEILNNSGCCIRLVCDEDITDEDFEEPIDINGRIYRYKRIGNLTWMIEDLKTNKATNGFEFIQVYPESDQYYWSEGGYYCYVDKNNLIY